MTNGASEKKDTFSYEVIHDGLQSGVQSCIIPGHPSHLVPELNVSVVHHFHQ